MKISVVIPAYNEEKFISNSLQSLEQQTEKPDEIIVIDNYSRDKTAQIAAKFGVKVIQTKTTGIGDARNKGFNLASHEIIARCDADTIVPPDWIKKIKTNFNKKIDALVGPVLYYDVYPQTIVPSKIFIYFIKVTLGHFPMFGLNMIITKAMWEKVKNKVCLNDRLVHEDIDLSIHVDKQGGEIGYDPTLIVKSSGRRIKGNLLSFFIEYPVRLVKTFKAPHL